MSEPEDLTRWNRAGLNQFRYVDGNAVEYLEILRQQLYKRFHNPETKRCEWLNPVEEIPANEVMLENETQSQRQERLSNKQQRILEMYHQDRRDWAWEISRTFARSCHILTEHSNAYINEGYLGTATQWDHVRRLVEMLDYHPAPPASASTQLVVLAKENKIGKLAKGFQVKNSPVSGADKVIFETLEDLTIDSALNTLRPDGWNQSEQAAAELINDNTSQSPIDDPQFSTVANKSVTVIQNVGVISTLELDNYIGGDGFKIKDFVNFDPDKSVLSISKSLLWEGKAKANLLINFAPEGNWSVIIEEQWLLPNIAEASTELLVSLTGNSQEIVQALKLDIEIVEICLDNNIYQQTIFAELLTSETDIVGTYVTSWHAPRKPKIAPNDVVMIYREYQENINEQFHDLAEAATIASIENQTDIIYLALSQQQRNWPSWSKGEARLKVSPRWSRKCWLNGSDVIRTVESHGLSVGAFISWKVATSWEYAEVIEADARNLRLNYSRTLPAEGAKLYELSPIQGNNVAQDFEVIVILKGDGANDILNPQLLDVPLEIPEGPPADEIFTVQKLPQADCKAADGSPKPGGSGGLLPPALLPEIGSFLFPSPMLPLDLVKAAVKLMLSIGVMQIPSSGEIIFKGMSFGSLLDGAENTVDAASNLFDMLDEMKTYVQEIDAITGCPVLDDDGFPVMLPVPLKLIQWDPKFDIEMNLDIRKQNIKDELEALLKLTDQEEATSLFKKIAMSLEGLGAPLVKRKLSLPKAVVDSKVATYVFNGSPDKVETGVWVVGEFKDGDVQALKVMTLHELCDGRNGQSYEISFEKINGSDPELTKLYADFRGELIAQGADNNSTEITSEEITLDLDQIPGAMKVGRTVLLTGCDKYPVAAKITSVDGNVIKTNPPATGCTKGNLIIYGNVALASHGEFKSAKILGSGDASKSNQEFIFEVDEVSFTPDATKSAGVAAAIEVEVAGRIWEQISALKDSVSGDHHYAIRMTEDGYVKIIFGDGENGRRLPTGKNNIRVSYRVGSGTAGNVVAGELEKPVNPHPLIDAILQPQLAAGGGDMEDITSLRENAPPTLLSLERAVSLSDFSHLATSQSSIWQAKAYSQVLYGGRMESVRVVIVPAGGVKSSTINESIRSFLQNYATTGVLVTVDDFIESLFDLDITLRIVTDAFIAEEVEAAVTIALKDHFSLKNSKLGQHFYLSEVYKIVESIKGVENSICVLNSTKNLQVIKAENQSTVIYLNTEALVDGDRTPSTLNIAVEEYLP